MLPKLLVVFFFSFLLRNIHKENNCMFLKSVVIIYFLVYIFFKTLQMLSKFHFILFPHIANALIGLYFESLNIYFSFVYFVLFIEKSIPKNKHFTFLQPAIIIFFAFFFLVFFQKLLVALLPSNNDAICLWACKEPHSK